VEVIEHEAASRMPPEGYREPRPVVTGSMVAIARRADASRRRPWGFALLAVITGGLGAMMLASDGIGPATLILGALTALCTYATMRAWARVLSRLRLEVRDGRLTAHTDEVWARTVSIAAARVHAIGVVDLMWGAHRVPAVALVARLAGDRTEPLLAPLSREDAETLRELASSALGLAPPAE